MSHFIVIYDRHRREDAEVIRIEDAKAAVEQLFLLELNLRADAERGVVMLVADDEETIRATHSHYFKSLSELLDLVEA